MRAPPVDRGLAYSQCKLAADTLSASDSRLALFVLLQLGPSWASAASSLLNLPPHSLFPPDYVHCNSGFVGPTARPPNWGIGGAFSAFGQVSLLPISRGFQGVV